jgi:DNA-binding transcriptional ArsR family regulator
MYSVFAALSDPLRLQIVERLGMNEHAVGELALALGRSQPTISKALRVLRDADLVNVRRVGQLRYYSLKADQLGVLAQWALAVGPHNTQLKEGDR